MTLCLKVQRPGRGSMQPWAYYPSESFEAQHSCTSWRCYLGMAADVDLYPQPGCGAVWRKTRRKMAVQWRGKAPR